MNIESEKPREKSFGFSIECSNIILRRYIS